MVECNSLFFWQVFRLVSIPYAEQMVCRQLLFLSSRARRDIHTDVSFLTTRVKKPDEDDWGKLKRALKYLNGTRRLKLTLTIESMGVIKWFIDGSHNTHWDCKGYGGAIMVM